MILYAFKYTLQDVDDDLFCRTTYFDEEYDDLSYAQLITRVSEQGFNNFIATNINYLQFMTSSVTIPDLSFSVSTFNFQFNNIKVVDLYFPPPVAAFYQQDQMAFADIQDVQMLLTFEFSINQKIYPYISETGTGQFIITDMDLSSFIQINMSENCPYKYKLGLENFNIHVQSLNIILDSQNSWLYQGLLNIVTEVVTNIFNEELTPYFNEAAMRAADESFYVENMAYPTQEKNNTIAVDIRYLDFVIYEQYFDMYQVDTLCYYVARDDNDQNNCTGHVMEYGKNYKINVNKPTNDEISYIVGKYAFVSIVNEFNKNETIIGKIFTSCDEELKIVNTGVLLQCRNDTEEYNLLFKTIMEYKGTSTTQIIIYLKLQSDDERIKQYEDQINTVMFYLAVGSDLGSCIQMDQCYHIYQQDSFVSINCPFTK